MHLKTKKTNQKMSDIEKWVKSTTKENLLALFVKHDLPRDNISKLSKLELVKILLDNGVEREKARVKRKSDDVAPETQKIKRPKTLKAESPLASLVSKIKSELGEPSVLNLETTDVAGLSMYDNLLIDDKNIVVGKFDSDGKSVVMLDKDDIEKSIGHKIDYCRLRIAHA